MRYDKFTAFAAALAILGGQTAFPAAAPIAAVAAESETIAGTVTLKVGESVTPTQTSGSETPSWYSEDPSVAKVSGDGKITAVSEGTTYVNAVFSTSVQKFMIIVEKNEQGPSEEEVVTDLGTVELSNDRPGVQAALNNAPEGDPLWTSSDENVATVTSDGTITAVGSGTCVITAVIGKYRYTLTVVSSYEPAAPQKTKYDAGKVELSDKTPSVTLDLHLDSSVTVSWSSTDDRIVSVDSKGTIAAHSSGSCTIIGETDDALYCVSVTSTYSGSSDIVEKDAGSIELTQSVPGKKLTLGDADLSTALWETTDENVAVPDGKGFIEATGPGTCDVRITYGGIVYIVHVTSGFKPASELTPEECAVTMNGIGAQMALSGGDAAVLKWESLTPDMASVDSEGKVTSKGIGVAVIKAVYENYTSCIAINIKALPIPGDADCDTEVKMNDVVLIMQCIADPGTYHMYEQGEKNADVYGNDGLSVMDALAIQKYLLEIYPSLPVESGK